MFKPKVSHSSLSFPFTLSFFLLTIGFTVFALFSPYIVKRLTTTLHRPFQLFPKALPPPLSVVYTPPPSSPPPFTTPHVLRVYYHAGDGVLQVFLSGVNMGVTRRGLQVVACTIDETVYATFGSVDDVAQCRTPLPRLRSNISVVLLENDALIEQRKGSVTLWNDVVVQLLDTDVSKLPPTYHFSGAEIPSYPRERLWLLLHSQPMPTVEAPFNPSDPPSYRYQFCLMTQIAPFSEYIPQWVKYHRRIGYDHVYIFDNGAAINLSQEFAGRFDVEVIPWPYSKSQIPLLSWFLQVARERCQFISHMDVDEFVMAPLGSREEYQESTPLGDAARTAERLGSTGSMRFWFVPMKNNGYYERKFGDLAELYTQRKPNPGFGNGKSLCRLDVMFQSARVHSCGDVNGRSLVLYEPKVKRWEEFKTPLKRGDWPYIVHFRERSWGDFLLKWEAGRASGKKVAEANMTRLRGLEKTKKFEEYMRVEPRLIWTEFRTHWRRVMKEGKKWELTSKLSLGVNASQVSSDMFMYGSRYSVSGFRRAPLN